MYWCSNLTTYNTVALDDTNYLPPIVVENDWFSAVGLNAVFVGLCASSVDGMAGAKPCFFTQYGPV